MSSNEENGNETESNDEDCPYEDIIGIRSNNGYSPEYLVKLKKKSYSKSIWLPPSALNKYSSGVTLLNKATRNPSEYPTSHPYYDPQFDIVDKIVLKDENGYFVKWMGLDYTQCTWENKVDASVLNSYRKKQKELFPTAHGNVLAEPSADFESQTKYIIGKLSLGYQQLACLNVLIANYLDQNNSDIVNQLNMNLHISVAAFFQYSLEMCAEPGPYLIVVHSQFVHLWYTAVHQIEKMTSVEYFGSTESRKLIQENDFFENDHLKFHILITSMECLIEDIDKLSDIKWKVLVFSDSQKLSSPFSRYKKVVERLTFGHLICYTNATAIQVIPVLQKVNDFILNHNEQSKSKNIASSAGELKAQLTAKLQKRSTNGLFDIQTLFIDCPLNEVQKNLTKQVILSQLVELQNHNCMPACQLFLRICNHPFIIYKQEFSMNGKYDFLECSTKLQVISRLMENARWDQKTILFVSHFTLMLELIEDVADIHDIAFSRISNHSNHFGNGDASVLLYNPDFCDIPTKAVEISKIAIVVDGSLSDFLSLLKEIKSNQISTVISLQCAACAENKLAQICSINHPHASFSNQTESEQIADKLSKLIALNSFSNCADINVDDLIDSAKSQPFNIRESEMIIDDLAQNGFWLRISQSITLPERDVITPINENEDYLTHEWTKRERNQLFRTLFKVGWDRNKELIELSGLRINTDIITDAARAIIRYVLRFTNTSTGHLIARAFVKESTSKAAMKMNSDSESDVNEDIIEQRDKDFINNPIFSTPEMNNYIHNQSSPLLKRIEAINLVYTAMLEQHKHHLQLNNQSINDNSSDEQSIVKPQNNDDLSNEDILDLKSIQNFDLSASLNANQVATKRSSRSSTFLVDWWNDSYDNLLAIATIMCGFGNYELFSEFPTNDDKLDFLSLFGQDDEILSYKFLNERFIALGESVRRNKIKEAEEAPVQAAEVENEFVPSGYKRNEELEAKFSKEEHNNIVKYLMRLGIDINMETGEKDYHAFAKNAGLLSDSQNANEQKEKVDTIRQYVEDLLIRCRLTPEEGGIPQKNSSILLKRVPAMEQLRSIFLGFNTAKQSVSTENEDDQDQKDPGLTFFETVTKWRLTPAAWTPAHEFKFFTELLIQGFSSLSAILADSFFSECFEETPPQFMTNVISVCRRISQLYEFSQKQSTEVSLPNETIPVEESSKEPRWKTSLTQEMLESGQYEYPIRISQTAEIYSLGEIVHQKPGFHTEKYIYPAGYKCSKYYPSIKNPNVRVKWFGEILDVGEDNPQFRIWMEDEPETVYSGSTPTAPWTSALKVCRQNGFTKRISISGPDSFLLNTSLVIYLLQTLPNVDLLSKYQPRSFPDAAKLFPKSV